MFFLQLINRHLFSSKNQLIIFIEFIIYKNNPITK